MWYHARAHVIDWRQFQAEFKDDGFYRYVTISPANADDWRCALELVRTSATELSFKVDGRDAELLLQLKAYWIF